MSQTEPKNNCENSLKKLYKESLWESDMSLREIPGEIRGGVYEKFLEGFLRDFSEKTLEKYLQYPFKEIFFDVFLKSSIEVSWSYL